MTKLFYYKDLEDTIFNMYKHLDHPDKLLIISGFLGPVPFNRLHYLPIKSEVIGGMYNRGINKTLFDTLEHIASNNSKIKLKFSSRPVHSKMYIWEKNKKIIKVLIGSANFSSSGLNNDLKETLVSVNNSAFTDIKSYINLIRPSFTCQPKVSNKKTYSFNYKSSLQSQIKHINVHKVNLSNRISQYSLPLFSVKHHVPKVYSKSGLNWGLSNGHTGEGDAYIAIPSYLCNNNQRLINKYNPNYQNKHSKKPRLSEPIDVIWDDGRVMKMSFEGQQHHNKYPKQLSSFSANERAYRHGKRISVKSILGRYLRKRMGLSLNHCITMNDLKRYGRTDITLSKLQNGTYFADFSVKNKKN